jgi:hypothetical protein
MGRVSQENDWQQDRSFGTLWMLVMMKKKKKRGLVPPTPTRNSPGEEFVPTMPWRRYIVDPG